MTKTQVKEFAASIGKGYMASLIDWNWKGRKTFKGTELQEVLQYIEEAK